MKFQIVLSDGKGDTIDEYEQDCTDGKPPLTITTYHEKQYKKKFPGMRYEGVRSEDKMFMLSARFKALGKNIAYYEEV